MIYKVLHYWVEKGTPKMEDINEAIEIAKKENCTISLNWKGPGYKYYGDTYSRDIKADSIAEEIYKTLPKLYGI